MDTLTNPTNLYSWQSRINQYAQSLLSWYTSLESESLYFLQFLCKISYTREPGSGKWGKG